MKMFEIYYFICDVSSSIEIFFFFFTRKIAINRENYKGQRNGGNLIEILRKKMDVEFNEIIARFNKGYFSFFGAVVSLQSLGNRV